MKRKNYFLVFFLFFCFLFVSGGEVKAQQSLGIKISPVKIDVIVDPGEVVQKSIKVTNESDVNKTLYVYLKDFKASAGEDGKPEFVAPGTEEGYFLASWIDITGEGIEFKPYEEKEIFFNINVPKEVGPGGYYGAVFFGAKPPKLKLESEDKGAGMAIAQQTGALILLQVKGDVEEEAQIREFKTDKTYYNTPFEINFLTRIENLGNVHIQPMGTIVIENIFGKEVNNIVFNDKGNHVLPHSIRKMENNWKGDKGFGRYKAKLGLTYGTAAALGGEGKKTLYIESYFWIIPWKIIIPTFIGIIFILAALYLTLRWYKNKTIKNIMQQAGLESLPNMENHSENISNQPKSANLIVVLLSVSVVLFVILTAVYFLFFD